MHWFLLASNFLFDLKDTLITKWSFVMSWAIFQLWCWREMSPETLWLPTSFSLEYTHTHTLKVKINFLNWVCNPFHPIPYLSWTWHVYMHFYGFQQFNLCWWASDWFMVLTPRTSCNGYAEPVGSVAHCWLHASWNLSRPVVVRCLVVALGWGLNNPGTVLWSVAGQWVL